MKRVDQEKNYWTLQETYADGSIKESLLGNGARTQYEQNPLNGLVVNQRVIAPDLKLIESRHYDYDLKGNLTLRENLLTNQKEILTYDVLDRLKTITDEKGGITSVDYDALGNIKTRSDRGTYVYGKACAGMSASPHALSGMEGQTYCYNGKGQLVQGAGKKVEWGAYDLPTMIAKGDNSVHFRYGPDGQRFETISKRGSKTTRTLSIGIYDEISDEDGTEQRHTLSGGLVIVHRNGHEIEQYLHTDHLGSVVSITDGTAEVVERFDYDPWGYRRDVATGKALSFYQPVSKHRFGFTGQEELDAVDLIHMNGRVYDPYLGRFLSPDPFVQAPDNLQSMNRYAYVWNNPLSNIDPSGYFVDRLANNIGSLLGGMASGAGAVLGGVSKGLNRFGDWISKPQNQRLVAALAISAVGGYGASYAFSTYGSWWASAAISGVSGYASGYVTSNGDTNYAIRSALTAAAFNGVGNAFAEGGVLADVSNKGALKTISHGFVGGASSVMNGGEFASGFLTAGFSESISDLYGAGQSALNISSDWGKLAYQTVAGAIVGGTTSELTGGTFENGALTAAMARIFNHYVHTLGTADEVGLIWDTGGTEDWEKMQSRQYRDHPEIVGTFNAPGQGISEDLFPEIPPMCAPEVSCGTVTLTANFNRGLWKVTSDGASRGVLHPRFGKILQSKSDGLWWAKDHAGHGGSAWKVFQGEPNGLRWYKDANQFGDFIEGKHKGPTGMFIPWSQTRGLKQ